MLLLSAKHLHLLAKESFSNYKAVQFFQEEVLRLLEVPEVKGVAEQTLFRNY